MAQTMERVSELLRNRRNSEWLERPELIESKVAAVTTNSRDQKRLFEFSPGFHRRPPVSRRRASGVSTPKKS